MIDLVLPLDLIHWEISESEFAEWVTTNNIESYAVKAYIGRNLYYFRTEEDYTAFTLTFTRKDSVDSGIYYAPYMPVV